MTRGLMRNPNVMVGRVGDAAVLFSLEDRRLHSLNASAATCWDLLEPERTVEDVIQIAATRFDVEADRISGDVKSVMHEFRSAGLCGHQGSFPDLSGSSRPAALTLSRQQKPTSIGPFLASGVPVVLEVEDPTLRRQLAKIVDPLPAIQFGDRDILVDIVVRGGRDSGDRNWSVLVNGEHVKRFSSLEATVRQVVASINSKPLDYLHDAVVFHAAAAEFDSGVVLFPGVSNAGKSTLITQLVHRGYKYLSDEAVPVTGADYSAIPFPKSISIDRGSQAILAPFTGVEPTHAAIDVDPRSVGPGRISSGGPVNKIIFPTYQSSSPTIIEPLEPFQVFERLLRNSFAFDLAGQAAFDVIVSLSNNVEAFALTHSGGDGHLEMVEMLATVDQRAGVR